MLPQKFGRDLRLDLVAQCPHMRYRVRFVALAIVASCNSKEPDKKAPPPTGDSAVAVTPSASAQVAAPSATASASAAVAEPTPRADPGRLAVDGKPVQGAVLRAKVSGRVKHISFP